ncbi:regulation of nuclear pre-mRNA domain-containing protein 2 isoform X7 [Vanessa cardui]|uniref:regulation of nuclear pre-mRNA domain-containing protein 2 isoform X7 n=1 Tax=Vanessa cardui TaxID=171605 RepID=UPI001F130396|nr:regulation of nuclear pre-mRNA domain-containing protein 2 isoform X7 [Vanessa cardui]
MGETEEFNTLAFEKKLTQLKDTQESIQSLSGWCLKQRLHHKKIVSSWLNVLKRVKVEQRLVLFYLANDVIQYSKRKNYEFVESWGLNLQKATPLVRDEKVRSKILRIFKIWEQRSVYDDEFLSDLTGLLSAGAIKKTDDDPLDFQPQQLVNKIKQCTVLEADTKVKLKYVHENHLELSDADALCASLKERSHKDDVEKELNEGIACVERYTQALQREIVAREALLALLTSANQYYSTQRGEVKVVAYAYKNFGARVRALKRKLDELVPTLPSAAPSPPQHDEDVPSPGPDEDLDLPAPVETGEEEVSYNIDRTFNTSLSADGSLYNLGLSSFLTSDNPMAIFNDTAELDISAASANISQKSQDALPGLDLLTPDSTGNPAPPTSFYGTMETITNEPDQPYLPEALTNTQWNNPSWTVPADIPPADVDHRGILPPPPPPPILPILGPCTRKDLIILDIDDVDHRLLPGLPPPPARHAAHQDVDHRNLISLTHQPAAPQPVSRPHIVDQDYRVPPMVPPMVPPTDIVESVDMDLSEDEEQQGMYPTQQIQNEHRRNSFNNNKVLVGGDVEKANHVENNHISLVPMNTNTVNARNKDGPHSAPIVTPLSNPFDNMPSGLKFNIPPNFQNMPPNFKKPASFDDIREENSKDILYEDDMRSRNLDIPVDRRNPSPPEYEDFAKESEWQAQGPRPFMNQRFPRNWGPRTNFRPQNYSPQFWPRNGPRPANRWMGPRPQRFW